MNCQQFTSLIVEAARGRLLDAAAREGAMRHAETCAACGVRLSQEQKLTGALRTVAAGMKDLSAPARVEAKLLAAFGQSLADSQAATTHASQTHASQINASQTDASRTNASHMINATPVPTVAAPPVSDDLARRTSSRRQTWRTAFMTTAIAASLALVALVTLYKQFTRNAPTPTKTATRVTAPQDGKEQSPVAPFKEQSPIAPLTAALPTSSPAPAASTAQAKHNRTQPNVRAASQRTSPTVARAAAATTPRMIASRQVIDGGRAIFAPGEGESAANHASGAAKPLDAESVTEFLPLVAGAPAATPLEGGQLVRVRLPRAALASLGLPLNVERGNEPVKADVLVGNDGLARAIRFVR